MAGPQPYAKSAKNILLSPATNDLGFADSLKSQVEDTMDQAKRTTAQAAAGPPITPGISPAVLKLFGQMNG